MSEYKSSPVTVTWLGHSCFRLEKDGYTVILDPYKDGSVPGLGNVRETADAVYCSHEHGDHNGRECVTLMSRAASPFHVTEIASVHDHHGGTKRGLNTIRIFDDGNVRIAHLGDQGCSLTDEQAAQLQGIDLALVPVGGFFTIDAHEAAELVTKIGAKHVIPMHYRDDKAGFGYDKIGILDIFINELGERNCVSHGSSFSTDEAIPQTVIVLRPVLK